MTNNEIAISDAGISQQIATAHAYPRDVAKTIEGVRALALSSEDVAGSCFYRLERKGKDGKTTAIEGPSIRLAEIAAMSWRNLRIATQIVSQGEKSVTVQALAHDLETNVAVVSTSTRSIVSRDGRRFSQDMIEVTTRAALSIARREAIFQIVPRCFINDIFEEAKKFSVGGHKTIAEKRDLMFLTFAKMGVKEQEILALLKKGFDAVDEEDLIRLRGMFTAIKDGDTTIDEVFRQRDAATVIKEKLSEKIEVVAVEPKDGELL